MGQFIELTGNRFGKLFVIEKSFSNHSGWSWLCKCDCGNTCIVRGQHLRIGKTTSCGCAAIEILRKAKTHGESIGGKSSPEYKSWCAMKGRCDNKNLKQFKDYGGRGIKYCDRWKDFRNFLEDMGRRPSIKHSLDRINVNGNYEPSNCRWATKKEQQMNMRVSVFIEAFGKKKHISEWADEVGLCVRTLSTRLRRGWPIEKALLDKRKIIRNGREIGSDEREEVES